MVHQSLSITKSQQFSGPMPHPELLAQYDEIVPGSAVQIIDQFVAQGQHRMSLEQKVTASEILRSNWGLAAGFIIAVLMLAVATVFGYWGYPTQAALLAGGTLASLVGTFVYGTERRRSERVQKAELMHTGQSRK